MGLSQRGRQILMTGLATVGFVFLGRVLVQEGIQGLGGSGGIDAIAYWTAAGHAWRGEPLYEVGGFGFGVYQYPPVFALLLAPASLLPVGAFVWLWRGIEILGLYFAVGGWVRAGIAILVFPPVIAEIDAANVHLILAGVAGLAMRGVAWPVLPANLMKFSAWPLIPIALARQRRGLAIGLLVAIAAVAISVAVSARDWVDYASFLANHATPEPGYKFLPDVPVAIRWGAAGLIGVAAVRWVRLSPIAVTLAYPIIWLNSLSTLAAVATPLRGELTGRGVALGLDGERENVSGAS